jgi:hypothetical protein
LEPRRAFLEFTPDEDASTVPMNAARLRILVADVAAMDARIRAVLHGDELAFARTAAEVETLLDASPFDLALVCRRFDDSKVFDLLRTIGEDRRLQGLPVVCLRPAPPLAGAPDGYAQTVYAMGAAALLDFHETGSSRLENDRIRRVIYHCIDRSTLMRKSNAYTRTLQYACDTLGGREQLAVQLGVPLQELGRWMAGAELPPFGVYSRALDIVAAGPFALPGKRDADAGAI